MTEINKRKEAIRLVKKLYSISENVLIIHYSSSDFNGENPRVTSISVKFLSGQTESFSLNTEITLQNKEFDKNDLDKLELLLLKKFFAFCEKHQGYNWVHWNMRNNKFGFNFIENRATILNVKNKYKIPVDRRFDLAILLKEIYSEKYSKHQRLENLAIKNNMNGKLNNGWKTGSEEAELFKTNMFKDIESSNLTKVDFIEDLLNKTATSKLKTDAKLSDIYSFMNPQSIMYFFQNHWIGYLISLIIGALIGTLIPYLLKN